MTIPTNGDPRVEYLPTTDTSTEKLLSPASLKSLTEETADVEGRSLLVTHIIKVGIEGIYQPTARIQPDPRIQSGTGEGYWSDDAWAQRFIYDLGNIHILFTAKEEGSLPNPYLRWCRGDAFVLMFYDTTDEPRVYRDARPGGSDKVFIDKVIARMRRFPDLLLE